MTVKRTRWALATSMMVVVALAAPTRAQEPVTFEVLTGAEVPGTRAWDFHMFPSALTAHPGDTLAFDWGSVMALPVGETEIPAGMTSFWAADPDDNGYKIEGRLFFPTEAGSDCGLSADDPCIFDGTSLLYPGDNDFSEGFYIQIAEGLDGSTFHVSNFLNTLTVTVDSGASRSPVSDPDMEQHLTDAAAEAEAVTAELNTVEYETMPSGHRVYSAHMGYDTDHLSFFEAFPQNLDIRKGDKIEWEFNGTFEPHTATSPLEKAKKWGHKAFGGRPVCDPDGDEGTSPDYPANLEDPLLCEEPASAELDLPNKFAKTQGDGKFPNRDGDYETSGIRGGPVGIPRDPYALKFVRRTHDERFVVVCSIHFNMKTRVAVE